MNRDSYDYDRRRRAKTASVEQDSSIGMTEDLIDLTLNIYFDTASAPSASKLAATMAPVVDKIAKIIKRFARIRDISADRSPEISSSGGKVSISYGVSWLYDVSPGNYHDMKQRVLEELQRSGYHPYVVLG